MGTDEAVERAGQAYERAVFGGDAGELDSAERGLDAAEAGVALARGRLMHARFLRDQREDPSELALFERAAGLYGALGDVRGEAEALFWVGAFHQIVREDAEAAVPALERSRRLAAEAGDELTLSYALRHLGFAEHLAGRLDGARALLEESVRLRRRLGFLPGVAANLVGLAYVAADQGRRDDATALLEEAGTIADSSGARGILPHVEQARADLETASPRSV